MSHDELLMRTGQLPKPDRNAQSATVAAGPLPPFCTTLFSAAILFMVSAHFAVIFRQMVAM